jgi:hypothetical protein
MIYFMSLRKFLNLAICCYNILVMEFLGCYTLSPSPSLPFSFLISVADMVGDNKQSYCRNSRGRLYIVEENTPPAAPPKEWGFAVKRSHPYCRTPAWRQWRVLMDFNIELWV